MGGSRRCVVLDCVNSYYTEKKTRHVSYHEVPSDQKQRKKWIKSLLPYMDPCSQRQLFHVCGDHFEADSFLPSSSKRKILTRDAVPTIFNMKEMNLESTTKGNGELPEGGAGSNLQDQQDGEGTDANGPSTSLIKEENCEMDVDKEEGDKAEENQCKYLFNSVQIYKENGRGEICRLCFKAAVSHKKLIDTHVTRTQTYKEMMEYLKLDINYDFYPDPVVCLNCIMMLLSAFDFKKKCEKTEKCLHKYYANRASMDKPTNLLIVASSRKKKNGPTTSETTIETNEGSTQSMTDVVLADHDYDVRTQDVKEKCEEEIELSMESPEIEEPPEEPPPPALPQLLKYKRITMWGDPPYLCEMCGRIFQNKRQCRRHLRAHRIQNERVESYYCEICECTYGNIHVGLHLNSHREKKYECKVCGRRFDRRNLLVNHIQGAHETEPYATCEVCGKKCIRKQLSAHVARHFDKKDAKCPICDKMVYRYMLKQHIRSHSAIRSKSVCHVCGKTVVSHMMRNHLWRHSEAPKYRCTICEVGFISEKELQLHNSRKKHIRNLMLYEVTRKERGEEMSS